MSRNRIHSWVWIGVAVLYEVAFVSLMFQRRWDLAASYAVIVMLAGFIAYLMRLVPEPRRIIIVEDKTEWVDTEWERDFKERMQAYMDKWKEQLQRKDVGDAVESQKTEA